MKLTAFVAILLSGCASMPDAPPPKTEPPPVPAWILEPGPSLIQLLDRLITPFEKASTEQVPSLPPAKVN